ncbi:MAG: DCC1-like thiol-disulfide oxidoreductase family protein, partial [Terriglobales bacterium]
MRAAAAAYRVLYDGQCEVCQACVAWLNTLDRDNKTFALPITQDVLLQVDPRLKLDDCLRQLHVITPEGRIYVGWDAVARLARLFPPTWMIGALGSHFPFRQLGRLGYGFVARNRYALSRCRGGACRVAQPEMVKRKAGLGAFWSCYTVGFFVRLPLVAWAALKAAAGRISTFVRTYNRRLDLLGGKLTILFLNGALPVAPSAIAAAGHVSLVRPLKPFVTPRALGLEEIPGIIEAYRTGAENAKKA